MTAPTAIAAPGHPGLIIRDLALPDLALTGNTRATRTVIAKLRSDQKLAALYATMQALGGAAPGPWTRGPVTISYVVYRADLWSVRTLDDDNLIYGMKGARDGIAQALGISDHQWRTGIVRWKKAVNAAGGISVVLRPRAADSER